MTTDGDAVVGAAGHAVTYYDEDRDLVGAVLDFALPTFNDGGSLLIVATPAHAEAIEGALSDAGIDTIRARAEQRLTFRDAATLLARFCRDGEIDSAAFERTVGQAVAEAAASSGGLAVYGEMVALLWADGDVGAALQLEQLWNRLRKRIRFGLLCGYPASQTSGSPDAAAAREGVTTLHTDVLNSRKFYNKSQSFAADIAAPYLARRFVKDTLRGWQCEALLDDALLVVSELATNAVIHSHAAFTVHLHRAGNRVRIAVRDSNDAAPVAGDAPDMALGGRGLAMVAAVSDDWGCEQAGSGKTVWAEFADASS
jgi:anti-sigma regulatory factor (Ser/Thr protein kinase)